MGTFAITQAQFRAIMNASPSYMVGDDHPVECVSWNAVVEFCTLLSQKTGHNYRLPSEAEWEYACRANTKTPFHFGSAINTDLANYDGRYVYRSGTRGEYRQTTTPVGSSPPRMPLVSMICMATFGNGVKIFGMTTILVRLRMAVLGKVLEVRCIEY
jgi:formylglycine-generating enzyme required for sulfatase activity